MTDHGDHPDHRDARLVRHLSAALTQAGELIPTEEDEVLRAEEEGVEDDVELPASMQAFVPKSEEQPAESHKLADLGAFRRRAQPPWRGWLSHAGAMALGAAAAALVLWRSQPIERPVRHDPAGVAPPSATASQAPVDSRPIELMLSCEKGCCAGKACPGARPGHETCSSGRTCVPCEEGLLARSRYRLRIGAVHPSPEGHDVLQKYPGGKAEICVRAGASDEVCVSSSLSMAREGGQWTVLPMVVTGDDLAAKLDVRMRWIGVPESYATAGRWVVPMALTPASLCSGYVVELKAQKDVLFGTMSLFIDDTTYVELMRADETATLRDYRKRLDLEGVRVQLQQVRVEKGTGFVLAAGPFQQHIAEQLRWQLIEQKEDARVTYGLDYIGDPMPLP